MSQEKHSHYKKGVDGLKFVDVYRVLSLFGVTDPCLQHACKKILCAGHRGAKGIHQDVQEAIDTLERWKDMQAEDAAIAGKVLQARQASEEPANQMEDDSQRMAAIGQNGNTGDHYSHGESE